MITLSLNIGSLIGILGLATFICDIVALYVHRSSDVYRQQKFQDVDLNLLRLETLNSLAEGMMGEVSKRKHQAHVEEAILTGHVVGNSDPITINNILYKDKIRQNKENNHHQRSYDNVSLSSTPILLSDNYHQKPTDGINALTPTAIKRRRSIPTQLSNLSNNTNDKSNAVYTDEDISDVHEIKRNKSSIINGNEHTSRPSPKLETFL